MLYRVTYEDGDTEDLDEGALQEIALPVATESAQTPSKGGRNGSSTAPAAPVQVSCSCQGGASKQNSSSVCVSRLIGMAVCTMLYDNSSLRMWQILQRQLWPW